jgi:exodeoxyribonuclease V gamma subunit
MYVHRSNRAEALVDVLARVVSRPLADPLAAECIVVQGRGMERWLSMELARRLGVWANPDFPFPRHLILRALGAVVAGDDAARSCFEPETLVWSVADLLPRYLDHPAFASIRAYLADDTRAVRRLQLAERIARTFDQYVVYRPEMVLGWERGTETHSADTHSAETHWQAVLWRALVERHGSHHVAALAREFLATLRRAGALPGSVPSRVSLFGVSTLAPLYLEMLAALSQQSEVHLFLLSPSPEYWAEIRAEREVLRRRAQRGAAADQSEADLHLEVGNPLLASLGRVGRDFQQVLESVADYEEPDEGLYHDPGTTTMLETLQSDILALRHRRSGNADAPPLALHPADESIAIHACHGPMREVEVLHDQLRALFEEEPPLAASRTGRCAATRRGAVPPNPRRPQVLEPREVLVMSPAIDAYAPFIDAVFGSTADHRLGIPYRIADRAVRATDDVVDAFLSLLAALGGRMTASEVVDLLGREPIRDRFGFVAEDLDLVRDWIAASGIRWGIDDTHRRAAAQPPLAQNTWRFGLDRLLLGYAMPGEGRRLFGGVLPYDDVEGTTAELLGQLAEFCEALFGFQRSLQTSRTLDAWRDDLSHVLRTMVASTNQNAYQHRQIRAALEELAERARAGQFHDPVELDTVQSQLAAVLERGAPGRGFLTGGVTFCALVPMRSIPFPVVCLLGMNDADFPRVRRSPSFDLIAQHPRPGDRSARDDDRYLFLEALLSARERLIITYVGRSIRDNSEIPPSVVVSELLDAIDESFVLPAGDARRATADSVRKLVVIPHPLQPFSPCYFNASDARLFSYANNYHEGARALQGERSAAPTFVAAPVPDDPATARAVSIDQLVRFFENPTRAFLQQRLGLYLAYDIKALDDREPLALDNLERWKVGTGLLERALEGEPVPEALPSVQASGALPPGVLGKCVFDDIDPEATALALQTKELLFGAELEPLIVDDALDGTRITGVIRNLWPAGQVSYQFSQLGRRHELGMWIRHLVLNWRQPIGYPQTSYLVGRPEQEGGPVAVRFRPVEDAAKILRHLLRWYRIGQTAPLPLFEKASRTYVERLRRSKKRSSVKDALEAARRSFEGSDYNRGDRHDDYVRQVFAGLHPLDPNFSFGPGLADAARLPNFAEVAVAMFGPMLDHREEVM